MLHHTHHRDEWVEAVRALAGHDHDTIATAEMLKILVGHKRPHNLSVRGYLASEGIEIESNISHVRILKEGQPIAWWSKEEKAA